MAVSRWYQLPGDILRAIDKRLNTEIDTLHLRAVCCSWRSSIPLFKHRPPFPLTLPFPICPNPRLDKNRRGHFVISQNTVYLVLPPTETTTSESKSNKPWLFRAEERNNGKRRPLNVLSRILTEKVSRDFPKVINLLDFQVFEIGRGFSLDYVETSKKVGRGFDFYEAKSVLIKKVVVSSTPFTTDGDDFEIMAIHGGKLGFIRLGNEKWSMLDDVKQSDDVVYHKGKFYSVSYKGDTVVIGSDLKPTQVAAPIPYGGGRFKKLANFGDDLYLIDKHKETDWSYDDFLDDYGPQVTNPYVEVHLKVYKLNEEEKIWEWVNSLGDKVVFNGDDCSYVVSARDFVGLKPNCIYFSEDSFTGENENLGDLCPDTGVYNLEDSTCGPLASFKSHSRIFWPPPSWLQPKRHLSMKKRHESHGVHLCRRCGWPFPKPHPSARHRRAHKKVCGTIEGYTNLIDSGVDSNDEHEDKHKSPSACR